MSNTIAVVTDIGDAAIPAVKEVMLLTSPFGNAKPNERSPVIISGSKDNAKWLSDITDSNGAGGVAGNDTEPAVIDPFR